MTHSRTASLLLCAALMFPATLGADAPTGKVLLRGLGLGAHEYEELESGEVLTRLASEYEQSPRELAMDAAVIIRRPLRELIEESEDDITLVPGKMILASGALHGPGDFSAIGFTDGEAEEAARWLTAKPGDDLNLGREDIAIIEQLKGQRSGRSDLELASEAVRQVLSHRYTAYLDGGLSAIEPYVRRRGKQVSAGGELKLSNEQLFAVDRYFPSYFDTLVNFPNGDECCDHRFLWLKASVRKRPMFVLVHRIVQETDHAVLLTERHFHVSHTLNSLQLTLGWLPYEGTGEDTYLGIATTANSDHLTGFLGKMIRLLGASKGEEMVGGVLVDIRNDLEANRNPRENFDD